MKTNINYKIEITKVTIKENIKRTLKEIIIATAQTMAQLTITMVAAQTIIHTNNHLIQTIIVKFKF